MRETGVQSLGQEDPLEEEVANHSTIFAWRIPWTEEEAGEIQSTGLQRVRQNWVINTFPSLSSVLQEQWKCLRDKEDNRKFFKKKKKSSENRQVYLLG